jgi:hypothetical protein
MNREQTIAAILKAARKPCMPIVEAREALGTDGKWYRCDFPTGVHYAGQTRIAGYVYRDPSLGCTVGIRYPSREAALQAHEVYEDKKAADFRAVMEQGTDKRLAEQAEYWLKNLEPEEATL